MTSVMTSWFSYILDNPEKIWDYSALSMNPNITFNDVLQNPSKSWDYELLSTNQNITLSIVQDKFSHRNGLKRCVTLHAKHVGVAAVVDDVHVMNVRIEQEHAQRLERCTPGCTSPRIARPKRANVAA
jgi:hypothetical protein